MSYRIFIDSSFRTILHFQLREKIFTQSFCLERKKNLGRLLKSCRKGVCVCVYVCSKFYNVKKFQTLFCFKSSAKCRKFEVLNIKSAFRSVGELFSDEKSKKVSKQDANLLQN